MQPATGTGSKVNGKAASSNGNGKPNGNGNSKTNDSVNGKTAPDTATSKHQEKLLHLLEKLERLQELQTDMQQLAYLQQQQDKSTKKKIEGEVEAKLEEEEQEKIATSTKYFIPWSFAGWDCLFFCIII